MDASQLATRLTHMGERHALVLLDVSTHTLAQLAERYGVGEPEVRRLVVRALNDFESRACSDDASEVAAAHVVERHAVVKQLRAAHSEVRQAFETLMAQHAQSPQVAWRNRLKDALILAVVLAALALAYGRGSFM